MDEVQVIRKNGPPWTFNWNGYFFECIKTKYKYRLFFESPQASCKPIWIGKMIGDERQSWVTCEKEIGAVYADFLFGKYVFTPN